MPIWVGRALFVSGAALVGLYFVLALTRFEFGLLDVRYYLAGATTAAGAESVDLAIILMDRDSEVELGVAVGSKWRQFHPQLIHNLTAAGARLIVFDAEFLASEPELDGPLEQAILESGLVVAGEITDATTNAALQDVFRNIGDVNVNQFAGVPRVVARRPRDAGREALAYVVVTEAAAQSGVAAELPAEIWINFAWPQRFFPTFRYRDVLLATNERMADAGGTPIAIFQNRIVLIGVSAGGADSHRLPNTLGEEVPGVFGQAAAVESLLLGKSTMRASFAGNLAWLLLVLTAIQLAYRMRRKWALPLIVGAALLVSFVAQVILLRDGQVWYSYSALLVASAVLVATNGVSRRLTLLGHLHAATGIEPALLEAFERQAAQSESGVIERPAAVLIADVRDYTYYTRTHSAAAVTGVLREHFGAMEAAISAEGGYVNKYVGDEIVAVFGFPYAGDDCATRAVMAAVAMLGEFRNLLMKWSQRGADPLAGMGIGVDTGLITFAQLGGGRRTQFDIVGNAINGAARIQDQTKQLARELLISEEVYGEIAKASAVRDLFAPVSNVGIRGQGQRLLYGWTDRSPAAVEDLPASEAVD